MERIVISEKKIRIRKSDSDMFRLVSDDDYSKNLNAVIAYYQISKGETKKRFVGAGSGKEKGYFAA